MQITFSKVDGVIGHERLKVIDAETAEDLWEKKGPAKGKIGDAAIVDGKVLLSVHGDGSDSVVHVYDAASGDELGSFPATPGFRSPVLEDGKLYYFYGNGIAARKVPELLKGTVAKGE
jgi:outer membrane protein assembly factor BamB